MHGIPAFAGIRLFKESVQLTFFIQRIEIIAAADVLAVVNAASGVLLIGAVNLLVSFGLALWVAMRARKIRFKRGILLIQALGRHLIAAPIDFFLGPKQQPISRDSSSELIMRDTK